MTDPVRAAGRADDEVTAVFSALDQLRDGVKEAMEALGTGLLRHPDNTAFRADFDQNAVHRALLRLACRLLFWFVAEERGALHPDGADEQKKDRYQRCFSARRLRDAALRPAGPARADWWSAVRVVLDGLGTEDGLPQLGLPGLGGIFGDPPGGQALTGLQLSSEYLLPAVRSLSRVFDTKAGRWHPVDFRNLGAAELGAIYESLLELIPDTTTDREFKFRHEDAPGSKGNPRKSAGSYYTPASLIDCLLGSTLDPVLDEATKRGEVAATAAGADVPEASAAELLRITVCDPACGSGLFLVAAARRIAKRVASVRERRPEPTAEALRHALRDVIGRCVYGVDLDPMAVELAKVALWLEACVPGKPLTFLDNRIKCGNALIGATPALIASGIPDAAFKAVEGDDPAWAAVLAKTNEKERSGSLREVRQRAAAHRDLTALARRQRNLDIADAWCAAFMWRKTRDAPPAITYDVFQSLRQDDSTHLAAAVAGEVRRLRDEYGFFHWHLEFPGIFRVPDDGGADDADPGTGWAGGFTVLLGNPPWDKVDFEDKKYFSVAEPAIAMMTGQARRDRIKQWEREHPQDAERYRTARRRVKCAFRFASSSQAYPNCALGLTEPGVNSLQTDMLFAELLAKLAAPEGRVGCIIPTAIATGAAGQHVFRSFSSRGGVASLYDFDNRKPLFPAVDPRYKFCVLSLTGKTLREPAARYAFFLNDPGDLDDPSRAFTLSPGELELLNPNTKTLPVFRSRRDAEITAGIHRRMPVLWDETKADGNLWAASFLRAFDMPADSGLCASHDDLTARGWQLRGNVFMKGARRMLPLYEAKMVDFYNHRAADLVRSATAISRQNQPDYLDLADLENPDRRAMPLQWIADEAVAGRLAAMNWERNWLYGWCDVTSSVNERTAIPAILPRVAVTYTFRLMFPHVPPALAAALLAAQSSLIFDYVSRQKAGGLHMNVFIWKQLPVPAPAMLEPHLDFIVPRVLELVYTARDMTPLARDLGDDGQPFRWDSDRRARLRAELDAFFFRLYGIGDRADVDYILETFQTATRGLKHNEIREHGEYRTKRLVLTEYDRMAAAEAAGTPYQSTLADPPGRGRRHPSGGEG